MYKESNAKNPHIYNGSKYQSISQWKKIIIQRDGIGFSDKRKAIYKECRGW